MGALVTAYAMYKPHSVAMSCLLLLHCESLFHTAIDSSLWLVCTVWGKEACYSVVHHVVGGIKFNGLLLGMSATQPWCTNG